MSAITDDLPAWVIWGEAPEEDWSDPDGTGQVKFGEAISRPVEIEFSKDAADAYVMRSIHTQFSAMLGKVEPGGTIAVMINRAPEQPAEEFAGGIGTSGSFVINNPAERHIWEFRVQKRKAVL